MGKRFGLENKLFKEPKFSQIPAFLEIFGPVPATLRQQNPGKISTKIVPFNAPGQSMHISDYATTDSDSSGEDTSNCHAQKACDSTARRKRLSNWCRKEATLLRKLGF